MLAALAVSLVAANPYLLEGRAHFARLEFEAATRSLAIAVEQPDLDVEERREGFGLWAQSLLAQGRAEEATAAYARLLREDPHAPAPQAAPKVVECFLKARQEVWPKPSVALRPLAPSGAASPSAAATVTLEVFDPWALTRRVRLLEATEAGRLIERPSPLLNGRTLRVEPSAEATRLLFDALDADGALLAHLEVSPLRRSPGLELAAPTRWHAPRWVTVLLIATATVAAAVGATFLGLGFRGPPAATSAAEVNAWNAGASRNAALGWSLGGLAVGVGVAAVLVAVR